MKQIFIKRENKGENNSSAVVIKLSKSRFLIVKKTLLLAGLLLPILACCQTKETDRQMTVKTLPEAGLHAGK